MNSFARLNIDKMFADSGLRTYKIRYEGQKGVPLAEPVEITPTPHISDLGVAALERPSFTKEGGLNVRQYSVKFNKNTLLDLSALVERPLIILLSRDARFGILKGETENWIPVRPLSEPVEKMPMSSSFLSVIFQPEKGPY